MAKANWSLGWRGYGQFGSVKGRIQLPGQRAGICAGIRGQPHVVRG